MLGFPYWSRDLVEKAKVAVGLEDEVISLATTIVEPFDNTQGIGNIKRPAFFKGLTYKGRPGLVEPSTKIGVEFHQMACAFGTSSARRKFWSERIKDGSIPPDVLAKYTDVNGSINIVTERMALHERFWRVPYHYAGLLCGDILHNNSIDRYTYHGNGGNGPMVGVAIEGHFPGREKDRSSKHTKVSDALVETGRQTLRLAVKHSRDAGAPIHLLTAHRCYTGDRRGDCGEWLWKEIALPIAKELDLEVQYTFKVGTGMPIPIDWDPSALYDYRGRRIT